MSVQQKISEQKVENERRHEIKQKVEAFCERFGLAVEEREQSLQYISDELDDHVNVVQAIAYQGPAKVDVRAAVLMYLQEFADEMEEMASELTRLSRQVKNERETIITEG